MKIIIQDGQGANHFIRQGHANAFRMAGHEVYLWDDSGKSPHDAFAEFPPDVFISSTYQLNRATIKCLSVKPDTSVLLHSDIWGPILNNLDLGKYPVGIATDEQKRGVAELVKNGVNIKGLLTQHNNCSLEDTHGSWKELGVVPYSITLGADITEFFPESLNPAYSTNIVYCGGYWPYKSKYIDEILLPLCYPGTPWKVKIFGSGFNVVNFLGNISSQEMRRYYRNADITPVLYEPHAVEVYADIPQRVHQTALSFGFQISQNAIGLDDLYDKSEIVVAEDRKDFHEKVVYYLNNPAARLPYMQAAFIKAITTHTSIHRAIELARILEIDCSSLMDILDKVQKTYLGDF